ncbi:hypothetical protein HMPREF0063_11724 [Aeromicrobium marinum DSM 15272]|uniref:DUF1353 domain-containing protein n=1 Tax=Aeromicrobium marinum DSM 15272 TaxID=585531 RepID=E2SDD8_9ACTN|nr:DUF1353 domain-containing protein [Aeromicrobium marinum]EFQ82515.1 hypothetical protein HMPREF0063_11724 [Aeromicrobium marinum DSM 15272]
MDLTPRPSPAQPARFHDGGTDTEPPDRAAPLRITLERDTRGATEVFGLGRRVGYVDEEFGELLVPADLRTFRTDLTSVPRLFTWLVPRSGEHLPAALVHDGLVDRSAAYLSTDGHVLDRVAADRVFRRALRDTHTGPVRRWLIWSAVTLATLWRGSASWSPARHLRYRLTVAVTLGAIAVLGAVATLDLFDVVAWLPWMGAGRPWWLELLGGAAGAVVVPLLLAGAWGRFAAAGAVVGVALAVLLHVTLVLAAITAAYQAAEWLVRRSPAAAATLAAATVLTAATLTLTLTLR